MEKCFVIQPFDKDTYDRRFKDCFEPAIRNAGLEPYRVDEDFSVSVPIEDIEKGIQESAICFAEITTNNPNIWYELGYAFACGKNVIMVCSEEREKFPFDIQHKSIIKYRTTSKSDFISLEDSITTKLKAVLQKSKTIQNLTQTPVSVIEGLQPYEITTLVLLLENQTTDDDFLGVWVLKNEMSKAGYNDVATSVSLRLLAQKGMIETFKASDQWNNNGEEYPACRLTKEGESWILGNLHLLQFRKNIDEEDRFDDLPFS